MSETKTVVGIDLGTTNSLIAVFQVDGPKLIPNASGGFLTPSAVGYADDGSLLIGQAAKDRLVTHPKLTTARFKRQMGTAQKIKLGREIFRAEDLSSLVLRSLKADAEAFLGSEVTEAVISVPAYFNDVQRQATIAAAKLAGLTVNRLINEPTAASLAYGIQDREAESRFLVVDLGGGTFDVSILEMFSGVMEVRASAGDAFLGGEDFTDALALDLAKQLEFDPAEMPNDKKARLRRLADEMKVVLTEDTEIERQFVDGNEAHPVRMTRDKFEEINEGTLRRLRMPIQRAISDAGLNASDLDRIILVGGATRMPSVRALITRLFKRFPEHTIDPDHVIALGAAVQAGLAERHEALEDMVMTDVAPFTLGYETSIEVRSGQYEDGHYSPVIERNTVVPVSRSQSVFPLHKGQTQIRLPIYQGEAPFVRDNIKLGELLVDIPKNKDSHEAVDVRFTYDTSGVLEVLTTVESTGKTRRLIIEGNPGALTRDEIEARLKQLERLKIHPREKQENTEFMARLALAYENSLGDLRLYIGRLISQFEGALATQDD
ncbi:MAG: molecular chaperone HscC, partial [Pseudomonadota bacterium]